MARPRTGEMPVQHIRMSAEDWDEFNAALGGKGAAAVREFVRWTLGRKGAKRPLKLPPKRDT